MQCLRWPEEDTIALGAKAAGGCELPNMGAVNWTLVFRKKQDMLLNVSYLSTHTLAGFESRVKALVILF